MCSRAGYRRHQRAEGIWVCAAHGARAYFAKPLAEIRPCTESFNTAHRFNMHVQPQLVLRKPAVYQSWTAAPISSAGFALETAVALMEHWMRQQIGPQAAWNSIKESAICCLAKPEMNLIFDTLTPSTTPASHG